MNKEKDLEVWSFSKIKATKGCKLAYEYEYIQNLPADTVVPEFEIAKELHEKYEKFLKNKEIDIFEVQKILKNYNIIETEKYYELTIPELNVKFIGYADIVFENEKERLIIDLKTRYNPEITEEDLLQLEIYSTLAYLENPKTINKIGIYAIHNKYCPLNIKESKAPLESLIYSEIVLAKDRIEKMKIDTSQCNYCKYRKRCSYGQTEIDETDIKAIAEKYLYLKAQLKRYESILRGYVETVGEPIQVGNKFLGYFESIHTKIDPIQFINLCKRLDIDFIDTLRIDVRKAKELAKKYEDLLQAFDFEMKYEFSLKNNK
jgi:CRISPR/Cas system-associated exonuclease Cas4 (RecB family)